MNTLYKLLKSMIQKGKTEGLEEKIDVFYAAGKLTEEEYESLMEMLHPEQDDPEPEPEPQPEPEENNEENNDEPEAE